MPLSLAIRDKGIFILTKGDRVMLLHILAVLEIIILFLMCFLMWQIWHYLHNKLIPDDEPLGEERTGYLLRRLKVLGVCSVLEAIMLITTSILNFLYSIS